MLNAHSAQKYSWRARLTGHSANIAGLILEKTRGNELNNLPVGDRVAVLSDRLLPQYLRARLFYTLSAPASNGSESLFAETVKSLDPNIAAEMMSGAALGTFASIVRSGVETDWLAAFLNNPQIDCRSAAGYMTASPQSEADLLYRTSSLIFDSDELDPWKAGEIFNQFPRFPRIEMFAKPRAFPEELRTIISGMQCLTRMKEILPFLDRETTTFMTNQVGGKWQPGEQV